MWGNWNAYEDDSNLGSHCDGRDKTENKVVGERLELRRVGMQ